MWLSELTNMVQGECNQTGLNCWAAAHVLKETWCKANAIKHVWIAEPQPMFSKKKYTCEREQSNYQIFRILKSVYISRYSKLVDIIVFRISRYALAHSFAQEHRFLNEIRHPFISTNFEYLLRTTLITKKQRVGELAALCVTCKLVNSHFVMLH